MCSFIFSSSSPFPPLISPPLLSPLVHPFPQTNQFASFLSILLAMPGHALSFVSRRYLHFQRPLMILSIPVASITLLPSRHLPIFRECSLLIHPILLITTQFHSQAGPCVCVCAWARCDGVYIAGRLQQQRYHRVGSGAIKAPTLPLQYGCKVTFDIEDGWRALCVCGLLLNDLHIQQTSCTLSL